MIKLCFCLFLLSLAFGAFVSIFIFAADVIKWHDKETKVKIKPSKDVKEVISDILSNTNESEVKENERDIPESGDTDPGECNTSAFLGTWSEP